MLHKESLIPDDECFANESKAQLEAKGKPLRERLLDREQRQLEKLQQPVSMQVMLVTYKISKSIGEFKKELVDGDESEKYTIARITKHLKLIVQIANQYHQDQNGEYDEVTKKYVLRAEKRNAVTFIAANEFALYIGHRPLSLSGLSELIENIEAIAADCHDNLHFSLGTLNVDSSDGLVLNYGLYVECGADPRVRPFVKAFPASEDCVNENYSKFFAAKEKKASDVSQYRGVITASALRSNLPVISHDSVFTCQLVGGGTFEVAASICLDYSYCRPLYLFEDRVDSTAAGKSPYIRPLIHNVILSNVSELEKPKSLSDNCTISDPQENHVTAGVNGRRVAVMDEIDVEAEKYERFTRYSQTKVIVQSNKIKVKNPVFGPDYSIQICLPKKLAPVQKSKYSKYKEMGQSIDKANESARYLKVDDLLEVNGVIRPSDETCLDDKADAKVEVKHSVKTEGIARIHQKLSVMLLRSSDKKWEAQAVYPKAPSQFFEKKSDINSVDAFGKTVLHYAAEWGNVHSFQRSLKRGACLDTRDRYGNTILHIAARNGDFLFAEAVLAISTKTVFEVNRAGYSPFSYVYEFYRDKPIMSLFQNIALWRAVRTNDSNLLAQVLELPVSLKVEDSEGLRAIEYAVKHDFFSIFMMLLHKSNFVTRPLYGDLIKSARAIVLQFRTLMKTKNYAGIIEVLSHYPDLVNLRNSRGDSLLHVALAKDDVQMTTILLENKANVIVKNSQGESPLLLAVKENKTDIARLLILYNSDIDECDNEGNSLLHLAMINKNADIVLALYRAGAKLNVINHEGDQLIDVSYNEAFPPLFWELIKKADHSGLQELLRVKKQDGWHYRKSESVLLHSQDKEGNYPMHYALQHSCIELIKVLVDLDPELKTCDLENDQHITPWMIALEVKDQEVLNLMLEFAITNRDAYHTHKLFSAGAELDVDRYVTMDSGPLFYDVIYSENIELYELVFSRPECKSNNMINKMNIEGKTLLHLAAEKNNKQLFDILLSLGANETLKDRAGKLPRDYFVKPSKEAKSVFPTIPVGSFWESLVIDDEQGDDSLELSPIAYSLMF